MTPWQEVTLHFSTTPPRPLRVEILRPVRDGGSKGKYRGWKVVQDWRSVNQVSMFTNTGRELEEVRVGTCLKFPVDLFEERKRVKTRGSKYDVSPRLPVSPQRWSTPFPPLPVITPCPGSSPYHYLWGLVLAHRPVTQRVVHIGKVRVIEVRVE